MATPARAPVSADAPAPSRWAALLAWVGDGRRGALALVVVVFALFGAATTHRATLDSSHFLVEDLRVRHCRIGELLTQGYWNPDPDDPAIVAGAGDLYRPVTLVWMAVLWQLASDEQRAEGRPVVLNLANIGLHALSVVLRFWLFLRLLGSRRHAGAIAFFAALLLAVHPITTEAVATQVGSAEALVAVGGTLALLGWHRWQAQADRRGAWVLGGCTLLALLAKENAIALVAIAPLGSWLLLRKPWADCLRVLGVGLAAVAVWAGLRLLVTGAVSSVKDPVLAGFAPAAALQMALACIGWYDVPALLWPFRLLSFVGHQTMWPPAGFGDGRVLAGAGALLAWATAVVLTWRRSPVAAFGLLFFALALFPVSNLVVPIGALAATRFLYLPLTGLALAMAMGVAWLLAHAQPAVRRTGQALAVALPLLLVVAAVPEVLVWRSDLDLQRAMRARSDVAIFQSGVGTALLPELAAATAARDAARITALQQEATACFEAAFAAPRPRIPGTELEPEDTLEIAFKSGMNLVIAALAWQPDPALARQRAAALLAVVQQCRRQQQHITAQTNWAPIESDTECLLAEVELLAAQQAPAGSPARAEALARAEQCVVRARAAFPDALRPEEEHLRIVSLRGDAGALAAEFEKVWARARPRVARHAAAGRIAMAFADFLAHRGDPERGLAIGVETMVTARDRFADASGFWIWGSRGMQSQNPDTRALARKALEIFLERADARDAANVPTARQLLGRR